MTFMHFCTNIPCKMYLNKISLFFISCVILHLDCAYSDETVPVFIWGSSSLLGKSALSSLEHVGKQQFSNELNRILQKDVPIVVFVEDKLSPEDFQCVTDHDTPCFKNLLTAQSSSEFLYYPSVEHPVNVLQSKSNVEVINFDSSLDDRQQLLIQHDELIQEKLEPLQKLDKEFIAIYTGKSPSWVIRKHHRVARAAETEVHPMNISGKVLLKFTNLTLYNKDNPKGLALNLTNAELVDHSEPDPNTQKLYEVTITDETYKLTLNFTGRSGYWRISGFGFDGVRMRSTVEISGINGFSFHCDPITRLISLEKNVDSELSFTELQVQPFFGETPEKLRFGDSLDCVGFMSAPILAGLFVTFMLASIVALGICMMMDLKTMDRFEDPKGKTITVTATD